MIERSRPSQRRRRGAVAVQLSLCLIPIVGVIALTLDGGSMMGERRRAQAVADSAAVAAGDVLFKNYMKYQGVDGDGSAAAAAYGVAGTNGYTNNGGITSVTVNIPPQSGYFTALPGYAEVIVQYKRARTFAAIWGGGTDTIQARAVAQGRWEGKKIGILVLDPTSSASFNAGGGGNFTTTANVIVDSNSPVAAQTSNNSSVTAPEFDITGGYSGTNFFGKILTGQPPIPDPLAYIPEPDPSTMPIQQNGKTVINGSNPVVLSPGVYKGGISISGTGNVTLTPGIYYMDGGGFNFSGQGSLTGNGIMIYNAPQKSSDQIQITGSGKGAVNVTPPSTGIYQGISLFQDRASNATMNVGGSGQFSFLGTFYAAGALLKITGSGPANNIGSQYISWQVNMGGNGNVLVLWDGHLVAKFRNIGLVE